MNEITPEFLKQCGFIRQSEVSPNWDHPSGYSYNEVWFALYTPNAIPVPHTTQGLIDTLVESAKQRGKVEVSYALKKIIDICK
jgi:hypothetical protein